MNKIYSVIIFLMIANTVFARETSLHFSTDSETLAITNQINYVLNWSDGSKSYGTATTVNLDQGKMIITSKDNEPSIVGCESTYWITSIPKNSIFPRDMTSLMNKDTLCTKIDDENFMLIPQFTVRKLQLAVSSRYFHDNNANSIIFNIHPAAPHDYTTATINSLKENQTPYANSFLIISDSPVNMVADLTIITKDRKIQKQQVSESEIGTINL